MDKLLQKEQCVEHLIASGITEGTARRLLEEDIGNDIADCIYRYAMLYPFFLCDEIIELCADISTMELKMQANAKDVIYLVRVFSAAQISTDRTITFFMQYLQECEIYDELRKKAYRYVRECSELKYNQNDECCTADDVSEIVSDAVVQISETIDSKISSVAELIQNLDKEYAALAGQCTKLKEECEKKQFKITEMSEIITNLEQQLADKNKPGSSITHKDLVNIAKAVKKKRYHLTADIISACKSGKVSCEDILFFIGNTSDEEEFKDIIKMYIKD